MMGRKEALNPSGGNSLAVGARVVRSGWVGLYGRPPSPYKDVDPEKNEAPLINVSLEELVPQDHFYRHLERTLDLSFVREFVQETYAGGGRPSIDPMVFFKLQLVMFLASWWWLTRPPFGCASASSCVGSLYLLSKRTSIPSY